MFDSRRILEAAMDEIALNSGAAIPASPNSAVTNRREACHCTYGYDLHIRSDGQIFKCFKMEESIGHVSSEPLADVWQKARRSCRLATDLPACADCPLVTLCGGGCRSENILYTGDGDQPLCGPWRKHVLAEMLADGQVGVVEWPTLYLINEARARQLDVPFPATPQYPSLNSNQRT
jgi:radical SAM protein with 4Fe4S-binding SPASM domain